MKPDYQIVPFKTAAEWRLWLTAHGQSTDGVWLRLYKKASGVASLNYAEALDEALCYGWIDGQRKSYDEVSYLQKFTPRRKNSLWSKRNIEHIARLSETGLMTRAGVLEVERAKEDGRWAAAYDTPTDMQVPESFLEELEKYPTAKAFYETLNKSNRYSIAWRLQTAKTDVTRLRRQAKLIAMLESGEKIA